VIRLWWRLVGFGFRLLYNELAFTYDLVSDVVSLGEWRCWQRAALKHLHAEPAARVLELAHGTGNLHLDLTAAGYHPVGYDLSPAMGRITQRKFARQGRRARLVRGMAQRLPFATGSFDAIVCTFPTSFITQPATLHEAHRVLKPGAVFVVVFSGSFNGGGLLVRLLEWLYTITGQRQEKDDARAAQMYTQLTQQFAAHGFDAVIVQEACQRTHAHLIVATRK
jgi:ubiquinone/menaquinone biosynthesis C-methylase UbiE